MLKCLEVDSLRCFYKAMHEVNEKFIAEIPSSYTNTLLLNHHLKNTCLSKKATIVLKTEYLICMEGLFAN